MSLPAPFRFALEAVLLVALGAALAAAELDLLPFVLLMGAAWILIATSERMLSRPDDAVPAVWRSAPERGEEPPTRRDVPKPASEAPRPRGPEPKPAEQDEPEVSQEEEPELQPERALEVVPEPEPEREPEPEDSGPDQPVVELPLATHRRPDGWNLWDLERRAHQLAGRDPIRDEEWNALFVSLRGFAEPDGTLPHEFDTLVEESFAELTSRPA